MKRLFTLAIIAMIATLTFAQAPVQKMKASDRKIEKVVSAAQMQKAMEAKAAFEAKAQAAQETSSSVLRKAAKRPSTFAESQLKAQKQIPNAQISRIAKPARTKSTVDARLNDVHKVAPAAKKAVAKGDANDGYIDVVADSYNATYYSTGDWYIGMSAGAYKFIFDIYADPEPLNGTYTWSQMDDYYSYAIYLGYYYDDYSDATFTIDAAGNVDAYCTLLNTGEKFHITYAAPAETEIVGEETWVFTPETSTECELLDLTADSGLFQLYGENPDGKLAAITITSDHIAGTYGFDDIYALGYYTNIYLSEDDYVGIKCYDMNATVTETAAQVDYYGENGILYHINFTFGEGGSDEPSDVTITKDANGIITSVEGGVQKTYTRSADGTVYYASSGSVYIGEQSGTVTVVEDGDKVYIKDPIARFAQNSWVEGTKNGNMVVVPCGQPLTYNSQWDATISLRYGVITADGGIGAADDYAENIVYAVDGDTWTLQNTAAYGNTDGDAYFVGAMWDDDDSFAGGEAETVLTYDPTYVAPSTDLVVLPTGAQVQAWTMNATSVSGDSTSPVTNQPVKVAFVGNDVYVQGIFDEFPTAWVKGTKSGSTVTFNKFQYIGNYAGSYDMYFIGTDGNDITDATATLSTDGQTLSFVESLIANAATDRIFYLTWLDNAVISAAPAEEPVITDLTATLPYVNGFDTDAEVAEAAIYDANGDGKTWTFVNDTNTGSTAARYTYHSSNSANDYVVFPGLALEAGKSYKVAIDARANGSIYPERIEIVAGNVAKASELTTVIVPETELVGTTYQTLTADFTPAESGVYYFAAHAVSEADMFYLYADNFSVKENNPNTPSAVSAFTAEAGAEGALTAKLTFTLPATTVGGAAIDEYVEYAISRDGVEIIQGAAAAGSTKTKTDNEAVNGVNNYSIVVKYNNLTSDPVSTSVYVGEDLPLDVENLAAADLSGKVGLSWDAVTEGVNGGYINPATLTYNVYPVEMFEFFGMQFPEIDFDNPYMSGISETNAEVEFDTNSGAQGYTYFGVTAENAAGETNGVMASVLTGAPYELPFVEEFPSGSLTYWWGVDYDDNIYAADGGLGITTVGELVYDAPCAGWIELMSGKVALDGVANPALSFSYKTDAAATLNVKVITPEGEENVGLLPVANSDYETATIDLSFYADQPWVRFNIIGEFETATQLYVDNIIVMDMVQNDLQVAVSAPKSLVAGKSATVKATVKNVGQATATGYDVKFYVNDDEVPAPLFETPSIAFMETATFEFELETSVFDELGDVTVKAEVVYAADEKDADNADEVVIEIVAPSATPVASVTAENTDNGVLVSWTVADNAAEEITEDFESYEGNTVYANGESCGPWAAVDLAPGDSYFWNGDAILWPHWEDPYAFGIMNFEMSALTGSFDATSGDQAILFMSNTTAADKYMISPELPGVAQTISFQAMPITAQYGAETFEVLASSTDTNITSFTKVANFSTDTEEWLEFSANLPEGTKYFAIRYTSNDIFGLFIDDLTYTAGGGTPAGFNVYVDENLVAALDAEARSYTYTEEIAEGNHDFSVTAVYGAGESAPVTATLGVATGIQNINAASSVEVYTIDGIRMNNVKNLKAGVYVVNGKKLVIK